MDDDDPKDEQPAPFNWPSREEWAREHQTFYSDWADQVRDRVSRRASDYASAEEIAAIVEALRVEWREFGRRMRAASGDEPEILRAERKPRNQAIKLLSEDDLIPKLYEGGDLSELRSLLDRYGAAVHEAVEKVRLEVESRPVDDAAWEKELERRVRLAKWHETGGLQ